MQHDGSYVLRPTARQRITSALHGLAETLSQLKSDNPNNATERQQGTRQEHDKARVRSQNIIRNTQTQPILTTSRFEKEREENTEILKLARRGFTSSEIARRLRVAQDQVETVIRLHRE
jgi:DNA-binding NarL/FixJ family response regulator